MSRLQSTREHSSSSNYVQGIVTEPHRRAVVKIAAEALAGQGREKREHNLLELDHAATGLSNINEDIGGISQASFFHPRLSQRHIVPEQTDSATSPLLHFPLSSEEVNCFSERKF